MKTLRKEKGITLLSLIITIVLLLIVSGVTLNIAIGDNGLFKKSQEAVNKGKLAQTEELIKMDLLSAYIDAELLGMDKPTTETIKKIVESYGGTIDESNPNVIQTPNGEIKLDKILGETSSDTNNPDEINKTIENLNNRITELNKALETERNEKKELQNSVNELNGQIEELNTQVASWKKKAEDGEVTIAQRDEAISTLNNQIETKNTEITTKAQRIEELEGNVTTLTNEKSTLETQVGNLNTRIAELEGKQATGDALAQDVLAGKTFSTSNGVGQTGTMVNRGTLNFNPTTETTQTVEPGYYSGGTLSTTNRTNSFKAQISSQSVDGIFTLSQTIQAFGLGCKIYSYCDSLVIHGVVLAQKWGTATDTQNKGYYSTSKMSGFKLYNGNIDTIFGNKNEYISSDAHLVPSDHSLICELSGPEGGGTYTVVYSLNE